MAAPSPWFLVSLALLVPLAAGCTARNPDFCCSSLESCRGTGSDVVVGCDPVGNRPFCDDLGAEGPAHTCIPDPSAPMCTADEQCLTPTRPVCDLGDTGTCVGCQDAGDCARFGERDACDPETRACVECVASAECTAVDEPICGDDGACRGCRADAECASGVCDEGVGQCVATDDIIYVDAQGGGTACTRTAPCARPSDGVGGISATRRWMVLDADEYTDAIVLDGVTLTILGRGARMRPAATDQTPVLVLNASTVTIEGLRLFNAGGGNNADGVRCAAPVAGAPALTLVDVRIDGNQGLGIDATSCAVTLTRGAVVDNDSGGVSISSGSFRIVNSYITDNGGNTAVGGVKLDGNDAASVFEFNTVAGNLAGSGFPAALACSSVQQQRIASNILWGTGPDQVTANNCELEFNLSNQGLSGGTNLMETPLFVSSTDYHLVPSSPGVDDADEAATLDHDFDGHPRPLPVGGRRDIGADEVMP